MGQSITPEMRDLRIEVYEGGKDAGLQLTGRSDWDASFFNVETEWFPVQFGELNTEVGFVFELIDRGDGSAGFLVPALEATDGTQLPPGEYRVTEGVVFVESDGLQSTTLFGDEFTVWFD